MTALERFGAYLAREPGRSPCAATLELLRLHAADAICAWAAGRRSPEGRAIVAFQASPDAGEGTLERILSRCALARLSEIDDIHLASCTTPGAVIVPAALTLAQAHGASRATLAQSILDGYEAMVRLGLALDGPTILYRGIWPTYFAASFGVAAAAARILGLDGERAAHALALALSLSAPGVGHQSGSLISRWIAMGHAARSGAFAARVAQAGFTADTGLLEGPFFPSVLAIKPDLAPIGRDTDTDSVLGEVSFKPWCAAKQTIAACHGLKCILGEGAALSAIRAVEVFVPPPYLRMVNHGIVPGDRSSFITSVPYQLAAAALAPEEQFRLTPSEGEIPREMRAFIDKVSVQADGDLSRHFPLRWPARVVVRSAAGVHEKLVLEAPGDPGLPLDGGALRRKFSRVLAPLLGEPGAAALVAAAQRVLEDDGAAREAVERVEHD
ncbi:MAG: MmgE/PrpD family protein [Burkholderiales bacterium]|nr:MmgE/PrpD family protein [Burkholderiales bacterium]